MLKSRKHCGVGFVLSVDFVVFVLTDETGSYEVACLSESDRYFSVQDVCLFLLLLLRLLLLFHAVVLVRARRRGFIFSGTILRIEIQTRRVIMFEDRDWVKTLSGN